MTGGSEKQEADMAQHYDVAHIDTEQYQQLRLLVLDGLAKAHIVVDMLGTTPIEYPQKSQADPVDKISE